MGHMALAKIQALVLSEQNRRGKKEESRELERAKKRKPLVREEELLWRRKATVVKEL